MSPRRVALAVALAAGLGATVIATAAQAASPIRHVFIIVLENESASTTFGASSPAPYLSKTLVSEGAYVPNYYSIGHASNDNYIAMISGQAPNTMTQNDCMVFADFPASSTDANGQEQGTGCVYPSAIQTIAGQLSAAGLTWRSYDEDMGADPSREPATCAHPAIDTPDGTERATATDQYATRHNPFVYFHSIIDDTASCDAHVVNLNQLPQDLANPAATPNYVFITPNLCDDGHDSPCANGDPGGLSQADAFLQTWVPRITGSAAFRQDGLLLITFDEAATSDTSSCCGEIPGPAAADPGESGPGGGQVGAVMLSPCIASGTVTQTAYNHYSMLRSVEDIFGLAHLAFANLPGETTFGSDVFNRQCGPDPPVATISAPPLLSSVSTTRRVPLQWSADTANGTPLATFLVQARDLSAPHSTYAPIAMLTQRTSQTFTGALGHTYSFEVQATNLAGQTSQIATATTVIPTGARPPGGHYGRGWSLHREARAWNGHAIVSKRPGATFRLRFTGTSISLIGDTGRRGGVARVTIGGITRRVHFSSRRRARRRIVYAMRLRPGAHHLRLKVLHGLVSIEGYAITPT